MAQLSAQRSPQAKDARQRATYRLDAFLGGTGGTLLESATVTLPYTGIGFIGFRDSLFDTIRITRIDTTGIGAIAIDTLEFNPAPVTEPSSLILATCGGVVVLGSFWCRRWWMGAAA